MHLGQHCSEETKRKISISNLGKNSGKKHTEETCQKMSRTRKGKTPKNFDMIQKLSWEASHTRVISEETRRKLSDCHKGGKTHLWKGGLTPETKKRLADIEWKITSDKIRERDGNMCRRCGKLAGDTTLPVHHLIPYRVSKDNSPINLITLCNSCHSKFENQYSRVGVTHYLKNFLLENIKLAEKVS